MAQLRIYTVVAVMTQEAQVSNFRKTMEVTKEVTMEDP